MLLPRLFGSMARSPIPCPQQPSRDRQSCIRPWLAKRLPSTPSTGSAASQPPVLGQRRWGTLPTAWLELPPFRRADDAAKGEERDKSRDRHLANSIQAKREPLEQQKAKVNGTTVACDDMALQLQNHLDGLLKSQALIGASSSFISSEFEAFMGKEL